VFALLVGFADSRECFSLVYPFMIKVLETIQFGNSKNPLYNESGLQDDE